MSARDTVLLAYDGSDGAKAALAAAARLFPDRPLLVLSVGRSMAAVAAGSVMSIPSDVAGEALIKLDKEIKANADALAGEGAKAATEQDLEATPLGELSDGNVWATILRVADEHDVATVVVGSRGLSGFKSILLGSVSSGVIHHSARPVVVVPVTRPGGSS